MDFDQFLNDPISELSNSITKLQNTILRHKLEHLAVRAHEDNKELGRLLDKLVHHVRYDEHDAVKETLSLMSEKGYEFSFETVKPTITVTNDPSDLIVHARISPPTITLKGILYKA